MRLALAILLCCASAHAATLSLSGDGAWPAASPGDTVEFSGTRTNGLTITTSGTESNRITLLFAAGAKIQAATFYGQTANAAIYASGVSNLTIDGGSDGLIEATDCGSPNTHSNTNGSRGISFAAAVQNITVQNLRVVGMYHRTDTNDPALGGSGDGIRWDYGGVNLRVQNCTVEDMGNPIYISYTGATCSNYFVISNRLLSSSVGLQIGSAASGSILTNCLVSANIISNASAATWDGDPNNAPVHNNVHVAGLHIWAVHSGSSLRGLRVERNRTDGIANHISTTAYELEGYLDAPLVYNNIAVGNMTNGHTLSGYIYLKGCSNSVVANNTVVGNPAGTGNGIIFLGWTDNEQSVVTNNFVKGCNFGIYESITGLLRYANRNVYSPGTQFRRNGVQGYDWAGWQGTGADANGSTNVPTLNADYSPSTNDTVLVGNGVSLTSFGISNDFAGVLRTNQTWTIGAWEVGSTNLAPVGQTDAPTFSPASGTVFTNSVIVTLSCATAGASVWYSTSGTATTNSTLYTGALTLSASATISAIAQAPGMTASATASATFTKYTAPEPEPPAASGSFSVDNLQLNRVIRR